MRGSVAVVTGSCGLIGSQATMFLAEQGMTVVGFDNNMREQFFGPGASVAGVRENLKKSLGSKYHHNQVDIRAETTVERIVKWYAGDIALIIHAAAQPSHDWAVKDPMADWSINAGATAALLDISMRHFPEAPFVLCSTNKVYGDRPNYNFHLQELPTRYDLAPEDPMWQGVSETLPMDHCLHSLMGASKVAADILTQEYGRYFGMPTGIFRGGCLTGPQHAGAELHGFLAYMMKCAVTGRRYVIQGYKGKQVRDNIHAKDVVRAFWEFAKEPGCGEVFNIGGGRDSNCSLGEAIVLCEEITNKPMNLGYNPTARTGDHMWYISNCSKLRARYPNWGVTVGIRRILWELYYAISGSC